MTRIDLIVIKIDLIVINRLDCDINRLDCAQNRLDCDKKSTRFGPRSTRLSAQLTPSKNRLDAKPSTQLCATFHSDSTLFESILQQSSRSFNNRVHLPTPTIATHATWPHPLGMRSNAVSKACLVPVVVFMILDIVWFSLFFVCLLLVPLVTI